MSGQAAKIAIQLSLLAALSRLLEPSDFGVAAMVTAIVAVGEVARDFGLSTAAVQAKNLSHQQHSNLYWVNVAAGVCLAAALAVGASAVSSFYGQPQVEDVARALSVFFVFSAASAQLRAQMIRNLQFGWVATIETAGYACGALTAVAAGFLGWGYWALVLQQLVLALVTMILFLSRTSWRPSRPRRHTGTRDLLRVGRNVFLTQALGAITRNADTIIIGRALGAVSVGVYSRAFQLILLPMSQVNAPATSVALPILSRVRDDRSAFSGMVGRAQAALLLPMVGGLCLLIVCAPWVVPVILGDGWSDVVPLMRILGVAACFQGASYVAYWVFVAGGHTGAHVRFSLLTRPLFIVGLAISARWGLGGVACGYAMGTAVLWVAALAWLRGANNFDALATFASGLRVLASYGVAALSALAVQDRMADDFYALILSVIVFGAAMGSMMVVSRNLRSDAREALSFLRLTMKGDS